jgi:DNA-binding transcriptional LysR family regulator
MRLNHLRAFEAVSTYLNMTRAADSLNISQPSIFKQVKSLEDFCGVRLYQKVGRRIELTREGRLVQAEVREILRGVERLGQKFKQQPRSSGGSLDVGGSHSPSAALIPTILGRFKESHPLTQVIFHTRSSGGIEELILQSQIEIGVITNPSYTPLLQFFPCRQENIVVVVSAKHPLAQKQFALSLAEVAEAPLIIKKGRQGRPSEILKQIESEGLGPNILMECESGQAIKVAVMKGMGIGILYRDQVESELELGLLKVLSIAGMKAITGKSFIVYNKVRTLSQNAVDFLTLLREPRQRIIPNGALTKPAEAKFTTYCSHFSTAR